MTITTLIIGCDRGNLGETINDTLARSRQMADLNPHILAPTQAELDIRDQDAVVEYFKRVGPVDEIVYAAGLNRLSWIKDADWRSLSNTFEVNVFGLVYCVAANLNAREEWGVKPEGPDFKVCAIVSDSSRTPMRGSLAYGSSKAALVGVIKNMARELAPHVVVGGVSPGIIEDTPMTNYIDNAVPKFRGWSAEQAANYERSMIPMQRRVTKQEVADTVQFFLDGPDTLAGSILEITGGK